MSETIKLNVCPKCGTPIPAEAPQGLCPKCVLGGAANPTEAGLSATATGEIPTIARIAAAFPQLEILELIGRGGMGFVFKARQPHLDRHVALKLLPDKLASDPHFAERFNREGRVLARLNHPNIVSVFDFGQAGGFYFLLMEYVDGVNLRQAMRAGRFSPAEALGIVPKICEALQYAHEQGVLHRDIKPENILLDARGRVKIADFGIAKLVGEDAHSFTLTGTGAALGTPHYMAPEQLEKPGEVDHRADIYSLGVVFYEMLTGELPIGRFKPPSERTPLDQRVDEIVMRALERERELRQKNVSEIKTQVERVTSEPTGAKISHAGMASGHGEPESLVHAVSKWSQKAVWAAVLTGVSLPVPLLLIVLVYLGAGGIGALELILALAAISLPGLAGTILGWMALSDIRAHAGRLRGLPLAVFAALAWPAMVLLGVGVAIPLKVTSPLNEGVRPLTAVLMLPIAAGTSTFVIWAAYAAARWGANQPASERRGKLKWIFLGVLACGLGFIVLSTISQVQRNRALAEANEDRLPTPPDAMRADANTTPWIRFTFTAVELREVKGVPWLAIDYLDDVHGECEKSFPWESTIPGFKAETRTTEFVTDAKDNSPAVRHQRIEYRMPDSAPRDQLEQLRDELEKALKQKSFRLELGGNEDPFLLFELPGAEGGSLKARIKVVPPLKIPTREPANPAAAGQTPLTYAWYFDGQGQLVTAGTTTATQSPAFSPTIERTLYDYKSGKDWLLNLESGKTFSLPAGMNWDNDAAAVWIWAHQRGIHVTGLNVASQHGLYGFEMKAAIVRETNVIFEAITPMQIAATLQGPLTSMSTHNGGPPLFQLSGQDWKNLYAFRTDDGQAGVLQVTGFVDNPRGVKFRYKLVQGATTEKNAGLGSARKFELRVPAITDDPYKSVGVTTDSELPVGDYLVGLLQRPDGRMEEKPAVVTIYRGSGRISARAMKHLLWPMSQFESNRVREIVAEMRATLDGRVIELRPDGRSPIFQATNAQGAITKGFIALRSQDLSAADLPPVTVSIADVPENWGPFLSVKIRVSAPPGFYPSAVGLLDDRSEVEAHTSIMGGGKDSAWSGDACAWYFPEELRASDVQEIVRQLEATKVTSPNGIIIPPGQRVPMFSVTNKTGAVFRGYFELPAIPGAK